MVAFGPVPNVAAHSTAGNPLMPKRDRAIDKGHRGPAPAVPRAPRPVQRSQSSGSLARDMWSRRPGSNASSSRPNCVVEQSSLCLQERPAEQDGGYRRVSLLSREIESTENQRFEMGPERGSLLHNDHSRAHILGNNVANRGMPWSSLGASNEDDADAAERRAARHTLLHEQHSADQALEWVPSLKKSTSSGALVAGMAKDFCRVNRMRRENSEPFEFLPGAGRNAPPASEGGCHARKNILVRESTAGQSIDMPRASALDCGGGVPSFLRDNRLARENPSGFALRGAGAAVLAA